MSLSSANLPLKLNALAKEVENITDGIINENDMLIPVTVSNCNATGSWSFSSATLDYEEGPSFPLCFLFPRGAESIIHTLVGVGQQPNINQRKTIDCLVNFINEKKHLRCLKWLKDGEQKTKAAVQAVLALHLFAPLVPDVNYMIDKHFPGRLTHCPSCGENIVMDDTSLGNTSVWHGNADILIERSAVQIDLDHTLWNGMEDEQGECPTVHAGENAENEPTAKKSRNDKMVSEVEIISDSDDSEVDSSILSDVDRLSHRKLVFSQAFARTIVNAFCEVKKDRKLSKSYIPSFLATETQVTVMVYNCRHDKLLYSDPLSIWKDSSSLDFMSLIHVWVSLNFETFEAKLPFEKSLPLSNLQNIVLNQMLIYSEMVSKPCTKAEIESCRKNRRSYALDEQFESIVAQMITLKKHSLLISNLDGFI